MEYPAYSQPNIQPKIVINVAEIQDIAKLMRKADPHVVINTFKSEDFYGGFYLKPIDFIKSFIDKNIFLPDITTKIFCSEAPELKQRFPKSIGNCRWIVITIWIFRTKIIYGS